MHPLLVRDDGHIKQALLLPLLSRAGKIFPFLAKWWNRLEFPLFMGASFLPTGLPGGTTVRLPDGTYQEILSGLPTRRMFSTAIKGIR